MSGSDGFGVYGYMRGDGLKLDVGDKRADAHTVHAVGPAGDGDPYLSKIVRSG
jgi:hypothetical protein